jgi:hypothetical protein
VFPVRVAVCVVVASLLSLESKPSANHATVTTAAVEAFSIASSSPSHSHWTPNIAVSFPTRFPTNRDRSLLFLLPTNNNDNNDKDNNEHNSWLQQRLQKANFSEIRRDTVLVTCFVLSRFLVYDILTSTKVTPGWIAQDVVWLTGTFSSATVLVVYWTIAGLLSKSFENSSAYGPVQVLVNVALCCPIWLATEHFLQFGPSNIGGDSLSQAIATGFLGLASFMTLARELTSGWD